MERSRKLVLTDWTKANDALNLYFEGNKSKLATHVKMSRTTVTAFFKPKPMREGEFRKLCLTLRLNWQEVSTVEATPAEISANAPQTENKTDSLQQIREHCRQKILSRYSRMRLLSGEEIGVDQLYVDVWLLHRSPRTYQVSESKLLETFDLRNDRLGLGDRIKRDPGFEIADASTKLLILGKPGAGKTTFLKHLAVDWCKGQFQPELIAVFIELRGIRDRQWKLMDAIRQELGLETSEPAEALLKQGKLLVLMDGLDEVPTNELRRKVQSQLQTKISDTHANNRWILTCRTQIIASIPDGFTSVEVADFRPEQVQQFVQNWFQAIGQSDTEVLQQWEDFDSTASQNPALKELTVTPVLLSLMCLVLHDEGDIPSQITDLYKRGIRLLLEKWNDAKAIEDWEVGIDAYRQLSVEQKEALLIEIAARKFENPKNFVLFEQAEIAAQITEFLHLANRKEGVAVLKAMEAQHGLLIERADELWSFSHLTFQEYFTVQWFPLLSPEELAEKIATPRWQYVVEQLVKSQQPADSLLRLIKQSIDQSIACEVEITKFLTWVLQNADSIQLSSKPAARRACYFVLTIIFALDLTCDLAHAALNYARALDHTSTFDLNFTHSLTRGLDRALDKAFTLALARAFDRDDTLAHILSLALSLAHNLGLNLSHSFARPFSLALALASSNKSMMDSVQRLEQPKVILSIDSQENQQWWQMYRNQEIEQLYQAIIYCQNTNYECQFLVSHKQELKRYVGVNKFLVDLMNIEGAVSDSVRAEIENTMFLPWNELQRRYPETYSSHSP